MQLNGVERKQPSGSRINNSLLTVLLRKTLKLDIQNIEANISQLITAL
jgi:hypothetical protein